MYCYKKRSLEGQASVCFAKPCRTMAQSQLLSLLFAFSLSLLLPLSLSMGGRRAEVTGMFVFGSSLVDNGNNNFLKNSTARADYLPYGIDFPLGPSGRFSNGRNTIDALGELLKLPTLIPPFSNPSTEGRRIIHGVNYASGGSGILDETGQLAGEVMSMNKQIENFQTKTVPELKYQLGFGSDQILFRHHLANYLFVIGTGGNDYLLNYFLREQKNRVPLPQFTEALISTLSAQIKKLYDLGASKFVLFSIQPIGCVPVVRANVPTTNNATCVEAINEAATLFNAQLQSLAGVAKERMQGSNAVYVNSYKITRDILSNPIQFGFTETGKACCELSSATEEGRGILCRRNGRHCSNRSTHVFFDGLHPTDGVNARIAQKAYGSTNYSEAYPMNVQQLARLHHL